MLSCSKGLRINDRIVHPVDLQSVKGIIFDLDGTLYRMRWFFRPLLFIILFPHSSRLLRFLSERSRFAGVDLGSREKLLAAVSEALALKEHASPAALRTWILDRFYPAFIATMSLQRSGRPRLSETLRCLKNRGIKMAVLSDYHAVEERLRKLRIPIDCFATITSCENSGALKPSVRPFTEIATSWGMAPASILVVGDRDDTDGEAARRAGMQFLLIVDLHRHPAVETTNQWEDVRRLLENLAATHPK